MKINVSKQGILAGLSRTFSDKTTFITELLQNCRRADATKVDITLDDNNLLTIVDDGVGIKDWDALLCVGDTGWNPKSQERPFGMGFFSALFAAKVVLVSSNKGLITFRPEDHMSGEEIVLINSDERVGTYVSLQLKETLKESVILKAVNGFSLPVSLNGEELTRKHQRQATDVRLPGIGWLSVDALRSSRIRSIRMYLQDIEVGTTLYRYDIRNYVHLDNHFDARMPDRNKLIDEEGVLSSLKEAVKVAKINWLREELAYMQLGNSTYEAHRLFMETYGNHLKNWNLYSDFRYIIYGNYYEYEMDEYPVATHSYNCDMEASEEFATSHEVTLRRDSKGLAVDLEVDEYSDFGVFMWLGAHDIEFFSQQNYPNNATWLQSDEDFCVRVTGDIENKTVAPTCGAVVLAEKIEICCVNEEIQDHLKGWVTIDLPFQQDGILYIPINSTSYDVANAIDQVENHWDEYTLDERAREESKDSLLDWFNFQTSGDVLALLRSNVGKLPTPVWGKKLEIEIDSKGNITAVEEK